MSYEDEYPLHKSVFINDLKRIPQLLKPRYINAKDVHGKLNVLAVYFFTLPFNNGQKFPLIYTFYQLIY